MTTPGTGDHGTGEQLGLFDEPAHRVGRPLTRVVLLCGPSGSGKSSLTRRLGLPVLELDHFYRDADDTAAPPMPTRFGIVDWDDARSWDDRAALHAILQLCATGHADVPVYDIAGSRRTGTTQLEVTGSPVMVAEGIFAAHLVSRCREAGVLAEAVCLRLSPRVTFWRRLLRDLAEARKPPLTLVRRGLALMHEEPALLARWTALGCEPVGVAEAERRIRRHVSATG